MKVASHQCCLLAQPPAQPACWLMFNDPGNGCALLALCCIVLQEYEDAAEDDYVSEYEDTDVDADDEEGPALPLHLEQALGNDEV